MSHFKERNGTFVIDLILKFPSHQRQAVFQVGIMKQRWLLSSDFSDKSAHGYIAAHQSVREKLKIGFYDHCNLRPNNIIALFGFICPTIKHKF